MGKDMEVDKEDGNFAPIAGSPMSDSGPRPEMIPVPDSAPTSGQLPSSRTLLDRHQHLESSFDKKCASPQATRA